MAEPTAPEPSAPVAPAPDPVAEHAREVVRARLFDAPPTHRWTRRA